MGQHIDVSQPFVDATLPGGHRLHVVLKGISRNFTAINIHKFKARARSFGDLIATLAGSTLTTMLSKRRTVP